MIELASYMTISAMTAGILYKPDKNDSLFKEITCNFLDEMLDM